jgi:enediyne biosynthesis protein E4
VNQGGKTFADKTAETFPKTPWGAMGVKAFDYDLDGDMDLFVTDMHSDMVKDVPPEDEKIKYIYKGETAKKFFDQPENNIFGNAFYKNMGDGVMNEVADEVWMENYWPWGVSVDDLNADGWPDVFITASMNFPYRYGIDSLMLNNRGVQFLDSEFLLGLEPRRGGRTREPWFTLDCSGEDRRYQPCAGRSGKVTVTGTLGTRSSVIFDLDGDGDLDIVTNEFNSAPQVLVSNLAEKRPVRWLAIELSGRESNRDGLGATVKVHAGPRTLTQMMDGKSGYLSHSVLPLYFGLGDAAAADRIEVAWPSGRKQTIEGPVPANRPVEIVEGPSAKYGAAGAGGRSPSGG